MSLFKPAPDSAEQVRAQAEAVEAECTFEAFRAEQATLYPIGFALVVLAFAASRFGRLLPPMPRADEDAIGGLLDRIVSILSKHLLETDYGTTHVVSMLLFVAFAVAGVWVLSHAHHRKELYMEANPYIKERATEEQLHQGWRDAKALAFAGAGFLLAAVVVGFFVAGSAEDVEHSFEAILGGSGSVQANALAGFGIVLLAAAVWCFVRAVLVRQAPSRFLYNCDALEHRNVFDIANEEPSPLRALLLAEKRELERAHLLGNLVLAACAAGSAALFFLPTLETPLWWIPLLAGVLLRHGAISLSRVRAQLRFSALADKEAE